MSECIFCGKPATHYVDYTEPMGDGYDTVCGDHAGKLSEPMLAKEQPATGAGRPHRDGGCGPQCAGCLDDARTEARRAALEEAAKVCDGVYEDEREYHGGQPDGAKKCRDKIRLKLKGGAGDGK